MPDSQPQRSAVQWLQELSDEERREFHKKCDEITRVMDEDRAKWEASPAGKEAAARIAEWDAMTPEERDALLNALPPVIKRRPIDEFTGMDDDEAKFLRDWLGD